MNYKFKHSLAIHICAFICWLVPNIILASVEVDGIYYDLNTSAKTAAVASNPEKYTGAVDIPYSFVYNGSTYNVKSIGSRAFLSCSEMTSINFPSSVTTIGSSAFERCTGLTDVVIGSGVTLIDYEAFKNCSNLRSLTLPSSLKTIENETFSGCTSLAEIIAKRTTPPTIVSTSFNGVDKTACIVYVPEGCQSTYANATNWKTFSNIVELTVVATGPCGGNLTYTLYSDMTMVISGTGGMWDPISYSIYYENDYYHDVRSVRKVIIEDGVTHIGEEAFCICHDLTSVSIPNSVTSIGKKAFQSCYGLNSVTIPSSLSIIEKEAFDDCLNLTSVYISDLTAWCNMTFDGSDSNPLWYAEHLYLNGVEIKDLVIPDNVSSVKSRVFSGCTGLTSLTIPNSVTSIGDRAFYSCTGLTSMVIPSSVMSIGEGAFSRCSGLTSITIPNSVTNIDNYAFEDCTGLRTITVESKIPLSIEDGVFESVNKPYCTLYVPAGYKSAYENAEGWSEFQNIEESLVLVETLYYQLNISERTAIVDKIADKGYSGALTIPESINYDGNTYIVTEIGDYSFSNCTGLISVNLPNSLKFINEMAFYHCTGLTSLTIPNGVTGIARFAFGECIGLTSLTIPSSVIEIGTWAFKRCENLNSITVESEFPFDVYDGQFSEVDKETCILYVPIGCKSAYKRTFGWRDFENIVENTSGLEVLATGICGVGYTIYSNLTMVISGNGEIWDALTSYHATGTLDYFYEFYNERQNVLKIIIEDGVTGIGEEALFGSHFMTSLTIPPSMTYIGKNAFSDCFHLTSVYISDLTSWCNITFDGSESNPISYAHHLYLNGVEIKDLVIPDNVSSVKSRVFSGCTDLTSLTIPNSVTSIGDWAFSCCTGLTSVVIPSSVTTIGEGAFSRCSDLASISIPNSVTTIGGEAFSETPWYDNQPDGLIYINHVAYKYKGEMPTGTEIAMNSGTVSISGNAFSGCTGLTSIEIPSSVTSIGNDAFSGCTGLTSIEIPSSVTSIGNAAFSYCSGLTSLEIPKSVTAIGDYAFDDCSKLTSIAVERETPPSVECSTFQCVNKMTCTLFVPFGSKSAYENADFWNEFENIVEVEFDTDISTLDNAIYLEQTEGRIGGTKDISVKMKNDFDVRGFQFTMELPEGATIHSWTLNQGRMPAGTTMNKVFATEGIDENMINVVCALNDGEKTFTGNDGLIATVNVTFAEDMEEGSYPIYLTHNSISDATAQTQLVLSDIKSTLVLEDYVLGDTNGDGMVLVGDVISILNYIVGSPSNNFNAKAADVNGDGMILVGDVIAVLNIIVNQ